MPAIRYRHNYKAIVLRHEATQTKGHLIPAYLKDGSLVYYPFGGFVNREVLTYEQYVKLVFIDGYCHSDDDGAWENISSKKVLGVFMRGEYFVVLNQGKPIMIS
ncbi:hypothetical protein LRP49_00615 [Enterovibrio sp. ZSDZ35]|uniref:Uncharacterized protein n=1 Tax=Enterovibrio qingdaonensis TaxID=2899818 RepID=A0ABT5QFD4_9GAMM|nr:hypothetical protein [Enterovibrio sp. ZSDZ35]MDD1779683.1 hypothetical protein [Enterovibrio sp. ZSDZ35]